MSETQQARPFAAILLAATIALSAVACDEETAPPPPRRFRGVPYFPSYSGPWLEFEPARPSAELFTIVESTRFTDIWPTGGATPAPCGDSTAAVYAARIFHYVENRAAIWFVGPEPFPGSGDYRIADTTGCGMEMIEQ